MADDQAGNLLAKSYFEEPRWLMSHVLAWIAFRNVNAITATYEDIRSARFGAAMYGVNSATVIIKNPLAALRKELRGGKIAAIGRNNSNIPQEYWDDVDMKWEIWPNVRFRRDDVLALFPSTEAPSATQPLDQPKPPLKTAPKGDSVRTHKAEKIAEELKRLYGEERPAKTRKDMLRELEGTGRVDKASPQTLNRAFHINGWV